jgi:filamentous hemagglutinin family protein
MFITKKTVKIFLLAILLCLLPLPTRGQSITTDGTTATDVSTPDGTNFDIDGGDKAGGNLFHSFGNFGVPTGGSANFLNSPDIQNIINRVTGGSISNIDGLISANGSANVFLLNPAGIVFGPNASLNIGGSFLGSTADSLLFDDGTEFSATNLSKPLLTINAPIGLRLRDNPASITNQSIAINSEDDLVGLEVNPGKNLTLIGGDINFDEGEATAPGGLVALGGLSAAGIVNINDNGSLTFPVGVQRGDVSLSNEAILDVEADNGGDISINARNINITGRSELNAGLRGGLSSSDSQAGNIILNATDSIDISDRSQINNEVGIFDRGNAGTIELNSKTFNLINSEFSTQSFGQGDSGNVKINSTQSASLIDSSIDADVSIGVPGKGGSIEILAGSLSLKNSDLSTATFGAGDGGKIAISASESISLQNSQITNDSFGEGNAGDIAIDAIDNISLDNSSIDSAVTIFGQGNGGDIKIATGSLDLTNNSRLTANTFGKGNAGNISIQAKDNILLDNSKIGSEVSIFGQSNANAGTIDINTGSLTLQNGSNLSSSAFAGLGTGNAGNITINARDNVSFDGTGQSLVQIYATVFSVANDGNGGDINITAKNLTLSNGGNLNSLTSGAGNAGNVNINVSEAVNLFGFAKVSPLGQTIDFPSSIISQVGTTEASGNGGNVNIQAGSLSIQNLASVSTGTSGQGNAGNVTIQVKDGVSLNNAAVISSNVDSGGVGKAGDIDIQARSLTLKNGGQIQSSIFRPQTNIFGTNFPGGKGEGGNIRINTTEFVDIAGFNETSLSVTINTEGFSSAVLANSAPGAEGPAGNISIATKDFRIRDGGVVSASTANSGKAGNIEINANTFESRGGGLVGTATFGSGDAGNITLNVKDKILITGSDPTLFNRINQIQQKDPLGALSLQDSASGLYASTQPNSTGNGGNIFVNNPKQLIVSDGGKITVDSQGRGNGGKLFIQAGNLTLDKDASLLASTASGEGSNIDLQVEDVLRLRNNSKISAQASGDANGGNININADFVVATPNQNNDIIAKAEQGRGGNIIIDTQAIFGIEPRRAEANNTTNDIDASSDFGLQGNISINTPDVNPAKNREQSPKNVVEPDESVAQACSGDGSGAIANSFIITGRGGMPPSPTETLNSSYLSGEQGAGSREQAAERQGGRGAEVQRGSGEPISLDENKKTFSSDEVVPARGMTINEKGQIVLTAYPTPNAGDRQLNRSINCQAKATKEKNLDRHGYLFFDDYLLGKNF